MAAARRRASQSPSCSARSLPPLLHWQSKTEKSMAELNIGLNLAYDFSRIAGGGGQGALTVANAP